jgi:hypothetical protein
MTPVARVAYQSGLTVVVTAQEAPDDVTGAAGVLAGGCDGGVSCELAALGWLVAGADLAPEAAADGATEGAPVAGADGWLTAGRDVLV